MGLIQRVIEAAGIVTISITLSREITQKVRPPRALYTGFPLGHPLGFAGQSFRQLQVLRQMLKYLQKIKTPGTIVEADLSVSTDPLTACNSCG
ncbi:hypothetical protein QUF90_00550 [Desulfococcaceae bacterium HSG9]|nr:hypothetical protein [Desulfococcaceae bacterium HSG9]